MKFNTNKSLTNYKPNNISKVNLICFASAGSGPSVFRQWSAKFEGRADVWAASYPGRDTLSASSPASTIDELVSYYVKDLSVFPSGGFILYGHSFGALVAYEVALKLQGLGRVPAAVCIGARRAPNMKARSLDLGRGLKSGSISDKDLVEDLTKAGGMPEVLLQNSELLEYYLPHIRNDLILNESANREQVKKVLSPIFGFYSASDLIVLPEEVSGWGSYTDELFVPISVSGGHFFLKDQNRKFFDELTKILDIAEG